MIVRRYYDKLFVTPDEATLQVQCVEISTDPPTVWVGVRWHRLDGSIGRWFCEPQHRSFDEFVRTMEAPRQEAL